MLDLGENVAQRGCLEIEAVSQDKASVANWSNYLSNFPDRAVSMLSPHIAFG
jgi:hypothetical protein